MLKNGEGGVYILFLLLEGGVFNKGLLESPIVCFVVQLMPWVGEPEALYIQSNPNKIQFCADPKRIKIERKPKTLKNEERPIVLGWFLAWGVLQDSHGWGGEITGCNR